MRTIDDVLAEARALPHFPGKLMLDFRYAYLELLGEIERRQGMSEEEARREAEQNAILREINRPKPCWFCGWSGRQS